MIDIETDDDKTNPFLPLEIHVHFRNYPKELIPLEENVKKQVDF
jgi:hypothetical protein